MDAPIKLELTPDEARVLLSALLYALQGKAATLAYPHDVQAANTAATKLENRLVQSVLDREQPSK